MKDEKGLYYYPFPLNKRVRMYVRETEGEIWFRMWNADDKELWETGIRIRNLIRAHNIRRGLRRKDEVPPADHWAVRDHEFEQKLLDDYYEYRGWDNDGVPKKETLDNLGLDYVSKDFIERGIITE